jgi:hypothetical protein
MLKLTKNPNYLGEILINLSFVSVTGNLIAYSGILTVLGPFFTINMLVKEISLKKK